MVDDRDLVEAAAAVTARTGLRFDGPRRGQLLRRLSSAMERARAADAATFTARIDHDPALFEHVVAALTVAETYFLREPDHFELLRQQLADLRARVGGERPLRLWSAGCATGEEPYSLAIILEEHGCRGAQVLGTDISAGVIARARGAVYGPRSLRRVDPGRRAAYFEERAGSFHLHPRIARTVRFEVDNLADPPGTGRSPVRCATDVIFCRNVLLYLAPPAVARAAVRLAASLAPGGWLVTASSDPDLSGLAGLTPVSTPWGAAYRRESPAQSARPAAAAPALRRTAAPATCARTGVAPARAEGPAAPALARLVRSLGDSGRLEAAVLAASQAVRAHPLDAELRHLHAVGLLGAGRWAEAAAEAQAAVYLAPDRAEAHAVLGHARHRLGRGRAAARNLSAAAALAARQAEAPTRDG